MYKSRILQDSVNEAGDRLVTYETTHPRFVHSEFMTHRVFSRNAASSRAIPLIKIVEQVQTDPVIPAFWGKNQSGMQAYEELTDAERDRAITDWLRARDNAVQSALALHQRGVHKQLANRLLEPWMWITVIVSATEWDNYFDLRQDSSMSVPPGTVNPRLRLNPRFPAQPEIQVAAQMMRELYEHSTPKLLKDGEWHLPMIRPDEDADYRGQFPIGMLVKISTGRAARVSYLTHDGRRDPAEDVGLCDRLVTARDWSPAEHQARAASGEHTSNFYGWHQFRKDFLGESGSKRSHYNT